MTSHLVLPIEAMSTADYVLRSSLLCLLNPFDLDHRIEALLSPKTLE